VKVLLNDCENVIHALEAVRWTKVPLIATSNGRPVRLRLIVDRARQVINEVLSDHGKDVVETVQTVVGRVEVVVGIVAVAETTLTLGVGFSAPASAAPGWRSSRIAGGNAGREMDAECGSPNSTNTSSQELWESESNPKN